MAIFLQCIGLYMVFPTSQTAMRLYTETSTPYEIVASSGNKQIDLDDLSKIDGVEAVSPFMQMECQMAYENKTVNFTVNAMCNSYLNIQLTDGMLFLDNTNMPYLLINKTAAKSFSDKDSDPGIGIQESVIVKCEDIAYKATISGIFQDDDTSPQIYMSYDVARKLFPSDSSGTKVTLRLTNKGTAESVVYQLQKKGYSASIDSNVALTWELLEQKTWQSIMTSIGYIACSIMLLRRNIIAENEARRAEMDMLALSGMTIGQIRWIKIMRLLFLSVISLIGVCSVACLIGNFIIVAVIICMILLCIQLMFFFMIMC